ncbi:Flp pilus assembly protein TadG [Abditibacterium utsteinense]|uniref:Flp pilus assembly protein TadG n=1 Tax=Abditibacterium utsteinense TaxID=1960156 RepID=A0A2S8SXB9_9BACT|nr:pilus assembly protein TadG-related protein [Abditibacterium utsteinense]PQV65451.1 Flp pilus assembly protein TadG [Abditibacterium utsteinense]
MRYNSFSRRFPVRRRGISMVLFVLSLPVIIGMTGLVVDLTNLYTRRAYAQRAADAAALAGAMASGPAISDAAIVQESKEYGLSNGYSATQVNVDPRFGGVAGKVQVTVSRAERVFFIPIMELLLGNDPLASRTVAATAIAQKFGNVRLPMGGNYGTTTGASNPSAFGPYAKHSYGDPYSVYFHDDGTLNDGTEANLKKNYGVGWDSTSHYNPDGFTYTMTVNQAYINDLQNKGVLRVELYDPDGFDSKDGDSLDEIHTDYTEKAYNGVSRGAAETTTRYTIEKKNLDGSFSEVVKPVEYGNDSSVDAATLKAAGKNPWITPEGFKIDLNQSGPGEYRIRVKTIDGSSENGYNLRAGPDYPDPPVQPRTKDEWNALESKWNQDYGDKGGTNPTNIKVPILADEHLQMNFTRTAPVKVRLGAVPATAAGQQLTVTKFDTDVGSKDIQYSFDSGDGSSPQKVTDPTFLTPTNDFWSQDKVTVPTGFKGGYLYAEYNAGQNDTSSWAMSVPGGDTGTVRLIK